MSNNCFILNFVWSNVEVTEIHTFGVADFCQQLTTSLLPSFHLFVLVLRNACYVFCYVIIVIQMIFFCYFYSRRSHFVCISVPQFKCPDVVMLN